MEKRRRILLAMELGEVTVERRAGIAEYAREAGWILESRFAAFLFQGQQEEYLASIKIDGILSMAFRGTPEIQRIAASAKVPVVDLWHDAPDLAVPRVLLDHKAAGRMAADHLLDLGLKRLLFYSHTVDRRVASIRRDGFREAAIARGVEIDELWWDSHARIPDGLGRVGWLAGCLAAFERPLGVMAVNDAVACDVTDAAEYADLRVPEDVAVVGVDNDPIHAELGRVPLTSVDVARRRVGYEAAALLDRMIDGHEPPPSPILIAPATVVTRRSTEVIAVADTEVNAAARFIRAHFREPITVTEVVANSLLSRRRLHDRFQVAIGHGIGEEITRQRINFAKHLLTQTDHKISSIATMAGFGGVQRMSKVFRRELQLTPQDYRQMYRPATER